MISSLSVSLYKAIGDAEKQRPMEMWHSSSLGQCLKSQYLQRKGKERLSKPTGAKILRWQSGHKIEEAIRPHLQKLYPNLQSNIRLSSTAWDMTGEFDNLNPDTNRIIEIKSVHDMAFIEKGSETGLKEQLGVWEEGTRWAGKAKWGLKQSPYLHHEYQNHSYALLLGEKGTKVEGIDYVYISLSGRLVTYATQLSPEVMSTVKSRLNILNEAWRTQTPPPCECLVFGQDNMNHPLWNSVLKYCDYRDGEKCCED